jgi:hypothetical protein
MMKNLIIAIDFDGTCVEHDYPRIGKDIGAIPILLRIQESGHRIMLWTMRSGETLKDAVTWFQNNHIRLWGINENPEQKKSNWSTSHKQYANFYIDDAAVGTPLVMDSDRPYVDWTLMEDELEKMGII